MDEAVQGLQQLGMQFMKTVLGGGQKVDEKQMETPVDELPAGRRLFAHADEAVESHVKDVYEGWRWVRKLVVKGLHRSWD